MHAPDISPPVFRRSSVALISSVALALIALALTTAAAQPSVAARRATSAMRNGWITTSRPQQVAPAGPTAVDANGTHRRILVPGLVQAPFVVSPDARRVACVIGTSLPTLYVTSADGRKRVRIGPSAFAPPSWSPDGSQLGFERNDRQLVVAASDGSGAHSLGMTGSQPAWWPSGDRIAFFSSYSTLELIRPDGSGRSVVATDAYLGPANFPDPVEFPVGWSPDGQWLVFGSVNPTTSVVEVNVARPDGSARRSFGPGTHMTWSPRSDLLAFAGGNGIEIAAPDGTVSLRRSGVGSTPVWSPDGRSVAVGDATGVQTVAIIEVATGALKRVPLKGVPVWSRDGRRLAVSRRSQLLVASRGAARGRVAARGATPAAPVWLRGDRVVFASMPLVRGVVERTLEGGRRDVFLHGPASFNWDRPPGSFTALAWSPNGRRLAVVRKLARGSSLAVTSPGTSPLRTLAAGATGTPSWSPDSRSLVFETRSGLRTVNVKAGTARPLTRARDSLPAWAPNGKWIAFLRPDRSSSGSALYVVGRDGRRAHILAHDVTAAPSWSPDGRRLVYAIGVPYEPTAIATIRPDGSGRTRLASAPAADETGDVLSEPSWSPDGRTIVYQDEYYLCGSKCSDLALILIGADGKHRRELRTYIAGPTWSPDGKQLLGLDGPGRLIAIDLRTGATRFRGGFVDACSWQARPTRTTRATGSGGEE